MKINKRPRGQRAGFTLIELLVVISIIAVLVALTTAAVMKFLGKGDETKRRSDISQMQASLASAKAAFGLNQQFPSRLYIAEDGNYAAGGQLGLDSRDLLMRMFKMTSPNQLNGPPPNFTGGLDWNGNGTIDKATILTGDQCLVFFLGGIPSINPPGVLGFSSKSGQPTAAGGDRLGPFFQFQNNRLQKGANGFFSYLDPYYTPGTPPTGRPYAYFSSYKRPNGYNKYGSSDCVGVAPYLKTASTYWNEDSFQIISAGPDKRFGTGGTLWGPNNPASGAGADDMSNFAEKLLGVGQ